MLSVQAAPDSRPRNRGVKSETRVARVLCNPQTIGRGNCYWASARGTAMQPSGDCIRSSLQVAIERFRAEALAGNVAVRTAVTLCCQL